jgi:1-acyl-sn-glycerol-3-phosphate acyltransferase
MLEKTMFDSLWLSAILRKCSLWFFRFNEWEVRGQIPKSVTKCVIVAAPHTTALDLPYMLMLAYIFRLRVFWIGKQELFFFPFKKIMLWLGGIPIDRTTRSDKTVFYGTILNTATEKLHLVIAPAGTRKNLHVQEWSTGFYYIALHAKVPIVLAYLDYKNRCAGIGEIFLPTGNYNADMMHLEKFYAPYLPKKDS